MTKRNHGGTESTELKMGEPNSGPSVISVSSVPPWLKEPIVAPGYDDASVTKKITDVVLLRPVHRGWLFGFAVAFVLLMLFNFCIAWLFIKGVGIWGINMPVAWGFAITNFVWWIGIGHAGTFISAILLLLHQDWPYAIEGVAEAIGFHKTKVPLVMLLGGICGALTAYIMQWYSATIDYRLNVGGRPPHSWPAFVPITFELTILFAAIAGVLGMLFLNGLPKPYHPVFNAPEFKLASQTKFFLCIEADDHVFKADEVREFFLSLGPEKIMEVEK